MIKNTNNAIANIIEETNIEEAKQYLKRRKEEIAFLVKNKSAKFDYISELALINRYVK